MKITHLALLALTGCSFDASGIVALDKVDAASLPDGRVLLLDAHRNPDATAPSTALAVGEVRLVGQLDPGTVGSHRWRDTAGWGPRDGLLTDTDVDWLVNVVSPSSSATIEFAGMQVVTAKGIFFTVLARQGDAWSVQWSSLPQHRGGITGRLFDIAFTASGDALVVYASDSDVLVYRNWHDGSWSNEQPVGDLAGKESVHAQWVELESWPGGDEIALAYRDSSHQLSVLSWNGSSWSADEPVVVEDNLRRHAWDPGHRMRAFDLAYESSTGDLMVAWGRQGSNDFRYATREAGDHTWADARRQEDAIGGSPDFVDLAAEPGTHRIAAVFADFSGTERLGLAMWGGGSWGEAWEADSQILEPVSQVGPHPSAAAVGWGQPGVAICVYPDDRVGSVSWARWHDSTGWLIQKPLAVEQKAASASMRLVGGDGLVVLAVTDTERQLHSAVYDGVDWVFSHLGEVGNTNGTPFSIEMRSAAIAAQ